MRLTEPVIASERYRGEPFTDESGRTQWPPCVLWDDELEGFGVRIYPPVRGRPSRKDFIVTWRVGLKSRTMAIGTYRVDCSLRQARRAAREALDLARRGRDPIEARQVALGIGTAEDLASRFLFEHTAAKKKAASGGEPSQVAAESEEDPGEGTAPTTAVETGSDVPGEEAGSSVPGVEAAPGAPVAAAESSMPAAPSPGSAAASDAPPAASDATPAASDVTPAETVAGTAQPPAQPAASERGAEAHSPRPTPDRPPRTSHGPTKMRLWSVPDPLYRDIERRARALGLSMTAYVRTLVERDVITPSLEGVLHEVEARQAVDATNAVGEPNSAGDRERR